MESISIEAYNFIRSALCEQEAYHEGEVYSNESAYTQFIQQGDYSNRKVIVNNKEFIQIES